MRSQQISQIRSSTPIEIKHTSYNNDTYHHTINALQTHLNSLEVKHNTYESNTSKKLFDLHMRIDKLEQIQNSNISDIQKQISERVDRDTSSNMFHRGDMSSTRLLNDLNNRLELLERKILKDKRLATSEQFENSFRRSRSFDQSDYAEVNNNNNNSYNSYNMGDSSGYNYRPSTSSRYNNTGVSSLPTSADKSVERKHYPWLNGISNYNNILYLYIIIINFQEKKVLKTQINTNDSQFCILLF